MRNGTIWVRHILAAAVLAAAAAPLALAGETWDGGGADVNWLTLENWNDDAIPINDGSADIRFAGGAGLAPNLDADWSIHSLIFDPTAGAFVLGSSNASVLTIGDGGLDQTNAGAQTVNHGVRLGASQVWSTTAGALIVNGAIDTNGQALTTTGAFAMNLGGVISGAGGLIKDGSAHALTLTGATANTYAGTTTVNAGELRLAKGVANGAIAGGLVIGDGIGGANADRVVLQASNQIADNQTVTIQTSGQLLFGTVNETIGDLVMTGGAVNGAIPGVLIVTGGDVITHAAATTAHVLAPLRLGSVVTTFNIADGPAEVDFQITGLISQTGGAANITKVGAGTMGIAGPNMNTYRGGLTINEGTVVVSHPTAAGLSGALQLGGGAIEADKPIFMSNPVTLVDATISRVTGSFTLALSGAVSGSGALNVVADDPGVIALELVFSAANTQTGPITIVNGGMNLSKTAGVNAIAGALFVGDGVGAANTATLQQGNNEQIPSTSPVTIASDGRWQLSVGDRTETINSLTLIGGGRVETGAGALIVNDSITVNDGAGAAPAITGNLDLAGSDCIINVTGSEQLQLQALVSNGSLTKNGPGSINVFAASTFDGGVRHNQGTIVLSGGAALGSGLLTLAGGTLTAGADRTMSNFIDVVAPSTVNADAFNLTFNGQISGSADWQKTGAAALRLNSFSSFTGQLQVSDGIVFVTVNNALGATSGGTVISDGAALEWSGNYTTPEPLSLSGAGPDGGGALRSTAGLVTFAGHITVPSQASIHGNNTSGGTIVLSGGIDVAGSEVTFGGPGNTTVTGLISGAGAVRKTGPGTLVLGGVNAHTGGTTVSGGTLSVADDTNLGAAGGAVTFGGGTLRVTGTALANIDARTVNWGTLNGGIDVADAGHTFSVAAPIVTTAGGRFTKAGAGSVNVNSISGNNLQVNGGTLNVAANGTPSGMTVVRSLTVATGAKLNLTDNDLIIDNGNLAAVTALIADNRLVSTSAIPNTTLGVILNGTRFTTFSGQAVDPTDVLVKFTYFGDANFDGRVSIADFLAADRGFARNLAGWGNGDFDLSGVIDGGDFFLIDQAFLAQGFPLTSPAPPATTVPEPGLLLLLCSLVLPLRRRR